MLPGSASDSDPAPASNSEPAWDLSLNYVPILFPGYAPAIIRMPQGQQELWRVVNASADTILDLQVQCDGVPQQLSIVALDGVPTGSMDGNRRGKPITATHFLLAPAARVVLTGPSAAVKSARLTTLAVDTGPDGDNDPQRPIATIQAGTPTPPLPALPAAAIASPMLFEQLGQMSVSANRRLYFSERENPEQFFITVDDATPTALDVNNPPAVVTHQGSVEDWTVENRSKENHVFHIHQVHFLVLERNGVAVAPDERQFLDTINIPYWSGSGPYPSVKLRMDFRGSDIGRFVHHCHILEHEDNGMMAIIRVLPP